MRTVLPSPLCSPFKLSEVPECLLESQIGLLPSSVSPFVQYQVCVPPRPLAPHSPLRLHLLFISSAVTLPTPPRGLQLRSALQFWKVPAFPRLPAWGFHKPATGCQPLALSERTVAVCSYRELRILFPDIFYHEQHGIKTLLYNLFFFFKHRN